MAWEMTSTGIEIVTEMVMESVSELALEKPSGMLSEIKLIGHLCFQVIYNV
jgi:hypothetical protein